MIRLVAFVWVLFLLATGNFQEHFGTQRQVQLHRADDLSDEVRVPEDALEMTISFLNKEKPVQKGFWIFAEDKLWIRYALTNRSDSTFYIEPPHYAPVGGNPTFSIKAKGNGKLLFPKKFTSDEYVPLEFIKLEPKSAYTDTVDLLSLNGYSFVRGKSYKVRAIYSSLWGAFIDTSGKLNKVWSGTTKSNVIEFRYPGSLF